MSFFKKPVVAVILAALIVICSTLLSVNLKLGDECRDIIDGFHDGVLVDGVLMPSIASQLRTIRGNADEIAYIAGTYGLDTEELKWAADDLRYGLLYSEAEASYLYYCYEELLDELRNIEKQLGESAVSGQDKELLSGYFDGIESAQQLIESSGYNETVRQFNREQLRFPADILGELAGVDFPELFT